jgi:hypothetical protein
MDEYRGYCNHEMNLIECHCWQWCEKAKTCPRLSDEGRSFQSTLVNVDNQIRPLGHVRVLNGNVIYAPPNSPYYDCDFMGVDIPTELFVRV